MYAIMRCIAVMLMAVLLECGAVHAAEAEPVSIEAFRTLERPAPDREVRYGGASPQAVDVFLPEGQGPHAVVVLIHGGCWRNLPGAGREQLRHLGADLAASGIAVWSIGYRRADEPGGGYPGTFEDVATAIDLLRAHAGEYNLDLGRVVFTGHSAGGHLALWASARKGLTATSPLYRADPLMPSAVISLGGVGDIERFAPFVPVLCGPGVLDRLAPDGLAAVRSEISPAAMPPPSIPVTMVSGVIDRLVPPYVARDYAQAMRVRESRSVDIVDIDDAGHFDLVTTGTPAWTEIRRLILAAARTH